jgi:ribonuclease P protein component
MKFGPERRVRKRHEFQAIQQQGRRVVTEHFVFILAVSPADSVASRLGITVTRRVGNSVRRSRLKRLIRAAFREENGMVPSGLDLVVICRHDRTDLCTQDVVGQFRASSKKIQKAIQALAGQAPPTSPSIE